MTGLRPWVLLPVIAGLAVLASGSMAVALPGGSPDSSLDPIVLEVPT
jgi:hypothetical protein